jgi:hypothetical protein
MPCANAVVPPALVARLPPMVQLRIEAIGFGCRLARALQRDAGFHRHAVGDRIDLADFVEPHERQ